MKIRQGMARSLAAQASTGDIHDLLSDIQLAGLHGVRCESLVI
jgi:hypothetical protein